MVNVHERVRVLFPSAIPIGDFTVTQVSADNQVIATWNPALGTQPTEPQLAAVTDPQIVAVKASEQAQREGAVVGTSIPCYLTADRTNSTTSFADCVGLHWILAPNHHYVYQFRGFYTAANATTGLVLAVSGPVNPVRVRVAANLAVTSNASVYGAQAAYDAAVVTGTNSGGAAPLPFWVDGNISTGPTGGPFGLRFRSESAGSSVSIMLGSSGVLMPVEE